jgi:hypothetical protein
MRNHLAVVMLSVLAGAAGGLTASYVVRRAAAPPVKGSAVQEPVVLLRDALAEEPMRFYSQGIDAYIANDMVKAQANFENAVKAAPTNIEARTALRRVNKQMGKNP